MKIEIFSGGVGVENAVLLNTIILDFSIRWESGEW